jgi:hypothetical protein
LLDENLEIGTEQMATVDESPEERQWTPEERAKMEGFKNLFLTNIIKALQKGVQTK